MSELLTLKNHYESIKADAEKNLQNIERLIGKEAELAKNGQLAVSTDRPAIGTFLKTKDVQKVIMSIDGTFSTRDVQNTIDRSYPGKTHIGKSVIANTLIKLIKEKKLEYVEKRSGQTPATYRKVSRRN